MRETAFSDGFSRGFGPGRYYTVRCYLVDLSGGNDPLSNYIKTHEPAGHVFNHLADQSGVALRAIVAPVGSDFSQYSNLDGVTELPTHRLNTPYANVPQAKKDALLTALQPAFGTVNDSEFQDWEDAICYPIRTNGQAEEARARHKLRKYSSQRVRAFFDSFDD